MIYEYECKEHGVFEVLKSMDEAGKDEPCPTCQVIGSRLWNNRGGFTGEKVEHAEWNPALGCVIKNKKHRAEVAERKGLVEIGNEKPDTIHREMTATNESIRNRRYDEAMNAI